MRRHSFWRGLRIRDASGPRLVRGGEISVEPGDTLLACTDGLSNMVEDQDIERILVGPSSVEARAKRLIAAANEAGGLDNISVVVVDVLEP